MSFLCVGYPSGSRCCDHPGKGVQSWFESLSKAELCPGSPAWSWWDLGLGCQQNDWNLGAAGCSGCLLPWKHPVAPCLFGMRWHWRVGRTRCTFPTWSERLWSVAVVCVCGKEGLAWVTVLEGLQQPALKGMGEGPRGRAPLSSLVQAAPTSSAPKAAPHP